MITSALVLASSLFWTDIGSKQALVCELSQLSYCLSLIPASVRQQFPESEQQIRQVMGQRSAMVMSASAATFAGLVLVNSKVTQTSSQVNLAAGSFKLALQRQDDMSLWHEMGHLENIALQGRGLPIELSPFQHEWLADVYVLWRSVHETQGLDLAWQQYHKRNVDVMNDIVNMSHWSPPLLIQVLNVCSGSRVLELTEYRDFVQWIYPKLHQYSDDELKEYGSLLQRTFGSSVLQPLPK
ncbi:MAG TPA: hypothetical protein VLA24_12800, partial [Pseudomonadales bacterium]|nr:hypothetical protein [Pseudomonadales bacterium]